MTSIIPSLKTLIPILLLLLIPLVFASDGENYPKQGGSDGDYFIDSSGTWATTPQNSVQYLLGATNTDFETIPKVADFNGTKYFIVYNLNSLFLYEFDEGYNVIDSESLNYGDTAIYGDFLVHNFNGENKIIAPIYNSTGAKYGISVISYNGTTLNSDYYEFSLSLISIPGSNFESYMDCHEDLCIMMIRDQKNFRYITFNDSGYIDEHYYPIAYTNGVYATANKTKIQFLESYDTDSNYELYHTMAYRYSSSGYRTAVHSIDVYQNGTIINNSENRLELTFFLSGSTRTPSNLATYIGGVLVFNFDGSLGNGLEVFAGARSTSNNAKLLQLDNQLSSKKLRPTTFFLEGELISDPIKANCYGSGYNDVAIMVYDQSNTNYVFMCSDSTTDRNCKYDQFEVNFMNITKMSGFPRNIHSFNADSDDITEIVTNFGVFDIEEAGFTLGVCSNNAITQYAEFETSTNNFIYPLDYQTNGLADMIFVTSDNIVYIDDGFDDRGAEIDEIIVDPCINGVSVKNGTGMTVKVRAIDDTTTVSTRVYVYYDETFEQLSNWSIYQTTGSLQTHNFILNETIAGGIIRVEARDFNNPADIDSEELSFTVSTTGVEFGDCESVYDIITREEQEEQEESGIGGSVDENSIKEGITTVAEQVNLSTTVIFLIIMGIILYNVWASPITESNPQLSFGTMIIIFVIGTIIGVKVGLVGYGMLLTMFILVMIPIGTWVGKRLLSHD